MKKRGKLMLVDEAYHRMMKQKAASSGLTLIKYTEKLASDSYDLEQELKKRGGGKGFSLKF